MTKVARIYEEMRLEYGKQEAEKARKETRIDTMYDMILRFMNKNHIKLIQAMDDLGISEADREVLMQRF